MNYALAYPGVRFTLEQDGRETLHTNGTGQLSDALVTLFGVDDFKNMVEVESDSSRRGRMPVEVYGFTSSPDLAGGIVHGFCCSLMGGLYRIAKLRMR